MGDFEKDSLGLIIVFEQIGFHPNFELARTLKSVYKVETLPDAPTNADKFRQAHAKEAIINFIDSTAFFGAFLQEGIHVKQAGNVTSLKGDKLYEDLLNQHWNKNTLYLDIRNEYQDSYNYYQNYSSSISLDLGTSADYSEHDYYANGWPMIRLSHADFEANDAVKEIGLRLPVGDNYYPLVYLKKGFETIVDEEESPDPTKKYLETTTEGDHLHVLTTLETPKHRENHQLIANYYQLNYIKRFTTPQDSFKGFSLRKESYLDNLFPIDSLKVPYTLKSDLDTKIYHDVALIDKSNINESEFTVNIGFARDKQLTSFIAYPQTYNRKGINLYDVLPLTSEQNTDGHNFIEYFNKRIVNENMEKRVFITQDESPEYLSFAQDEEAIEQNLTITSKSDNEEYEAPPLGKKYDLENTNIIALTNANYERLVSISETEFPGPYKVYLGVANTEYLTEDSGESTNVFALRGLRETDAGEIEAYEYITDLDVVAEDDLYNWDDNTADCELIDAYWSDENGKPDINLPYGNDRKNVVVRTKNAIGKRLVIRMVHVIPFRAPFIREIGNLLVESDDVLHEFEFKSEDFSQKTKQKIIEYHLEIKVCNSGFRAFAKRDGEKLRVHAVRFVPKAMQALGWGNAQRSQSNWFAGASNSNLYSDKTPVYVDFIKVDWIKSFDRVKMKYDELVNSVWNNDKSINVLKGEIKDMVNDGILDWPTQEKRSVKFGSFSKDLILKSGVTVKDIVENGVQMMPFYEKYYYALVKHEAGIFSDPLDDFFGTFGSYNWHATAKGTLEFIDGSEKVRVTINKIAVYVRDQFDFGRWIEPLGYWKLNNEFKVTRNPFGNVIEIENASYRNYRDEIGKGGDYWQYSELEILDKHHTFEMDIS